MVRIPDGQIVAIGGLMQTESSQRGSGVPGTSNIPLLSSLLGNRASSGRKREIVVLIQAQHHPQRRGLGAAQPCGG